MTGSHRLANLMRREAARQVSTSARPRFGFVDAYNPKDNTAKVVLSDANASISGWLPVQSIYMGNGWGAVVPLSPGDQVLVLFGQDDQDSGVIVARIYDDQHAVPKDPSGAAAAAGELLLVHETGATIKLQADGRVLLHSTTEVEVGNVLNPLLRLVNENFQTLFNNHQHGGVTAGSGVSGAPTTQMPNSDLTSILKAN